MKVELLHPDRAEDLERFVSAHPYGTIEQTWAWGDLQTSIPGRNAFFVFVATEGKKIVGSMLVIRQHMGHGKYWLWCPGGPLLPKNEKDEAGKSKGREANVWLALKKACEEVAKKEGDVYLRIESNYPAGEFCFGGKAVKDCYLPRNTLTLDLELEEAEILKQMKQKGRYNIKQAKKTDVYVRIADEGDLDDFYEILLETAKRDAFHLHEKKFYEQFLTELGDKAKFYIARHEKDMLGGILAVHFGNKATYYFGASSSEHRQKMAPYALQWFAMREAKNAGCVSYDFLGIAPEGDNKHVLAGVTQFKTRFGGERTEYETAQVFIYRPVWWRMYLLLKSLRKILRRSK